MRKNIGLILSIAICFVLAGALIQNFRAQHETQRQLADMQKRLDRTASPPAASPGTEAPVVVVQSGTTLPSAYAQTHQQVLDVMNAGWKLINQRNPAAAQNAADLFQGAIAKIDPKSPDLYNGLGRALLVANKPREAIAAWKTGLQYAPAFAEMQSGIGWAYWNLHDPYHAKRAWDAAVHIDDKCADAWSALAWIDLALGDIQTSKSGFQVLLALDRTKTSWIIGLSMAKAGNRNVDEIDRFFRLPPLSTFTTAVPDPLESVASTAKAE